MLKVRITNRMSHEDYIAESMEYPYVLSRRHLLGICSVFVVCMVMVLPTPEIWLDNSSQKQVLTQAGRDYLAADESETEKALAATEHELIPHQENYDDYDIPLDQFASSADDPSLTDNSSTDEQDSAFEQMATSDYEGVTDSAIANNGEWDWESLSNDNEGTRTTENSQTQTQTGDSLLANTDTNGKTNTASGSVGSDLVEGSLVDDSVSGGKLADGSTTAQSGSQSSTKDSALDGNGSSLAANDSSDKATVANQDLTSGTDSTSSDKSTPASDNSVQSNQQLAQNSKPSDNASSTKAASTADTSNVDHANIASNKTDKTSSHDVLEASSKGASDSSSEIASSTTSKTSGSLSPDSAQNQQLVAQNTSSTKLENQAQISATDGKANAAANASGPSQSLATDTASSLADKSSTKTSTDSSTQLAQNQSTVGKSSETDNKSDGVKSNTVSQSQSDIKDQKPAQDTKLAQAERPTGTWYRYTIESGDNFSAIFKSLSLPYATLNRITKVAKRKDLSLDVGEPVYFLVDKDNILKELVKPLEDEQQVRFTRMTGEEDFKVVYEAVNSHVNQDEKLLSAMPDAFEMPSAVKAQEARRQRLLAQEKAIAERKAYEKANNINPNRPRLLIGEIKRGENFARAAHREGLTPTEIKTMTNLFKNKINVNKLRSGDKFRVLFTGIGTQAGMCAISIRSSSGNFEIFMNPKDRNFYGENEYTPTAGIFRRFPLAGEIKVNSPFNPKRRHPVTHRISPHNGVDFKANVGTPVYAPADGVVTFSGYQRAAGYYIIVRHANNYSTVYMHLSKSEVKKGEKVIVGQVIARSGNTGRTTGPHLHYEIRINDQPVNPLKVELPSSSHPNLAREQREAFANNVKILRADLQNDRLAATTQP